MPRLRRFAVLRTVLVLSASLFALTGGPAAADLSLAGRWQISRSSDFGPLDETVVFGQSGTTVTSGSGYTGTINPSTGVFHLDATRTCFSLDGPPTTFPATVDATLDVSGTTFSGTYADAFQAGRSCLALSGVITGTFLDAGPTCGNGAVDAGEDCDGGACCDSDCHFRPSGASCGTSICYDYVCSAAHACIQDPAQPDGDADGLPDRCDFCRTGDACTGTDHCLPSHCVAAPVQCQPDPDADADLDGIGNLCDACTAGGSLTGSRLDLVEFEGGGSPRLLARGEIALPANAAAVDPLTQGMEILVQDAAGTVVVGAYSGVAEWKARHSGDRWVYRTSTRGPIESVALSASPTGMIRYRIRGTTPPVAGRTVSLPLRFSIVFGTGPATATCGEQLFDGPVPCLRSANGRRISCRTP